MPMNPHPLTRTGGRTLSSMDYLDSYTSLAAELKRQGWFRKATGRLMMEFTFHLATSDKRRLNLVMAWIGYPILGQFSVSYWWKKHNTGHHRVPNVIGVDND